MLFLGNYLHMQYYKVLLSIKICIKDKFTLAHEDVARKEVWLPGERSGDGMIVMSDAVMME